MASKVVILVVCILAFVNAYGTSKTSLSKPHQGKFHYDIEHHHHGHWHGAAHPHGYGGLGSGESGVEHRGKGEEQGTGSHGHGLSFVSWSKPHQGKYHYDIEHKFHGHWHGAAHPHAYGGLGDGHGSYKLAGAMFQGFAPQGGHGGQDGSKHEGHNGHHHKATSYHNFNIHSIAHHKY